MILIKKLYLQSSVHFYITFQTVKMTILLLFYQAVAPVGFELFIPDWTYKTIGLLCYKNVFNEYETTAA